MQRIPTRSIPQRTDGPEAPPSPLIGLARRIREEQGPDQVKAFFSAMTPFAAPGELKHAAESFGIEYVPNDNIQHDQRQNRMDKQPSNAQQNMDQLQMIRMLMQLKSIMGSGSSDPFKLIEMFAGK